MLKHTPNKKLVETKVIQDLGTKNPIKDLEKYDAKILKIIQKVAKQKKKLKKTIDVNQKM